MVKSSYQAQTAAYRLRKMKTSRVIGMLSCLLAFATIVIYYMDNVKFANDWMCIISLTYCLGSVFNSNSFLQDMKVGNPWQRVNGIISIAFYILMGFLIVWGFITKELVLQF